MPPSPPPPPPRKYILQTYTQNAAVSWFLIGRSNEQGAVSFTWFHESICDQVCRVISSLKGRPTVQYASVATSDLCNV